MIALMASPPATNGPLLLLYVEDNDTRHSNGRGAWSGSRSEPSASAWWRRIAEARRPPPEARPHQNPHEALQTAIESWTAKANWNESAARRGTQAIIVSSALIPIALLVSTEVEAFLVSKAAPAILAAIAAAAAAWLQFYRPYEEWKLYRGYQRRAEHERLLYENGLCPYNDEIDIRNADKLARTLIDLQCRLQAKWAALLPSERDVGDRIPRAP